MRPEPKHLQLGDDLDGERLAGAHLSEIAALLALGVLRLKARQSRQKERETGDTSLDNSREESVDRTANSEAERRS